MSGVRFWKRLIRWEGFDLSANAHLLEGSIRHQIYLLRRGAGLANEAIPEVERIIEQVVARVASTPDQMARQRVMLAELRSILASAYSVVNETALQGALELGEYEAEFQVKLLGEVASAQIAAPAVEQVLSAVQNDVMDIEPGRQVTIRQALDEYGEAKGRQIAQTISDGIVQQQTSAEIARSVQGLQELHKRQADALVRTIANGAADNAKRSVYRENADILKGERWTSTLDSRVSLVCASRDSKVYPVDEGPRPPAHWNCRSVMVPVVRDEYQLPGFEGERPAVGDDGAGVVSARTTYSGFLRSQSKEFQESVLGVERARLFRSGKVNLSDLVNRYGEPITLDQLRASDGITIGG